MANWSEIFNYGCDHRTVSEIFCPHAREGAPVATFWMATIPVKKNMSYRDVYLCGQECLEQWRPCNGSSQYSSSRLCRKCLGKDICYTDEFAWKCPLDYQTVILQPDFVASDHILGILCEESKKVKRSNKSGLFCSFRNLRLKPTKVSAQRMLILD